MAWREGMPPERTASSDPPTPGSQPGAGRGPPGSQRRDVVGQACERCRKRHIRCDGDRPECKHCRNKGIACEYSDKAAPARPSNARLHAVEEERNSLLNLLERIRRASPEERELLLHSDVLATPAIPITRPSDSSRATSLDALVPLRDDVQRGMHFNSDGQATFHGPSSTFYDSAAPAMPTRALPQRAGVPPAMTTAIDVARAEAELSEAAADARHFEMLNLAAGRLDFDGVSAEVASELLAIHWSRQHHALLLTYRPAFMRDMAVPGGGRYFSKLLLNAIFFSSSKFSTRVELRADPNDPRTAGFAFLRRTKELLGDAMSSSRITTIQALLLLSSSLFALGQQQTSWLYSGLAFRMIVDLGLHVDAIASMPHATFEDIEIARRVLWGAFAQDKLIALYQGRPPSLQASEMQVPLIICDRYEETELWRPFAPSVTLRRSSFLPGVPAQSVTTFIANCRLMLIVNRIIMALYTVSSLSLPVERHLSSRNSLSTELDAWYAELNQTLRLDPNDVTRPPPPANVLALHCTYATTIILVHRPFIATGHLRDASLSTVEQSWRKCSDAAERMSDLMQCYDRVMDLRRAPFLISWCGYIAATILVRLAAQHGAQSSATRRLRLCMAAFSETENVNPGVSKAKQVLTSLMDRLGVRFDDEASPTQGSSMPPAPLPLSGEVDMDALFRSFLGDGATTPGSLLPVDAAFPYIPNGSQPQAGSGDMGDSWWTMGLNHNVGDEGANDVLFGLTADLAPTSFDHLLRSHDV